MKKVSLLAVCCLTGFLAGAGPLLSVDSIDAWQQLLLGHVKHSEQTLNQAWQSDGSPRDRIEAGVMLANELWRIDHKFGEARKMLAAARALDPKSPQPLTGLSLLETARGDYVGACESAREALTFAETAGDKLDARAAFGHAVCEEIFEATLRSTGAGTNAGTQARVDEAVQILRPIMQDEPGWKRPSRCQLLLALLAGDGPDALRAWQSFNLLFEKAPGQDLVQLLPGFTADADAATREKVVRAIAECRFYPEAAILALRWQIKPDQSLTNVITYGRWTDKLSQRLAEEYRRHALGRNYRVRITIPHILYYQSATRIESIITAESKKLWHEMHPGTPFSSDRFLTELGQNFGVIIRLEAEADPDSFTYGHHVGYVEEVVDQYGRKKVLKCTMIDNLVCNGYQHWLTEGFSGTGGWAIAPDTYIEIFNDYSPFIWDVTVDPEIHRRHQAMLARYEAEDETRAKTNACGFFPGLQFRLFLQSNERVLQRLKDSGLRGTELRTAFLRERQRLFDASTMLAHEGRHVLDFNEQLGLSRTQLEFRAKCSEVIFAPDPFMSLGTGTIFSPNIGEPEAGHAMANTLVMKGLLVWMQAHAAEIPTLDPSRPLLPQFDRLNDDQIRAAFRSLDPWAKTKTLSSKK